MAAEGAGCSPGAGAGSGLGMADEHDGYEMVCGLFPCQPSALSGLLRDSSDPDGPDSVRNEEMGLLDRMAFCEHSEPDALLEGRAGLHADRQLPISYKRYLVVVHLVQTV